MSWLVSGTDFDAGSRQLTVRVDFERDARFAHPGSEGLHPVHDTQMKHYRRLNFFQHECVIKARGPRVRLPDGRAVLVELPLQGKMEGFTLLFAAVARVTSISWHKV